MLASLRQVESRLRESVHQQSLRTWCYVDTGPLVERVYAKYAGTEYKIDNEEHLIVKESDILAIVG